MQIDIHDAAYCRSLYPAGTVRLTAHFITANLPLSVAASGPVAVEGGMLPSCLGRECSAVYLLSPFFSCLQAPFLAILAHI